MLFPEQERRIFKRLNFTSQVKITHNGRDHRVACKDVNAEGMSIYLPETYLKLHDEIAVRFDDQDTHFPALTADADVIRVQMVDDGFVIALEFVTVY